MTRLAPPLGSPPSRSPLVSAGLRAAVIGVSLAIAAPAVLLSPTPAFAQAAPADTLQKSVEDFWHFGKVARYDVAAAKAQEILASGAEPLAITTAFEK
ncbi:MAG TPA: hypothetical protein VF595_00620, partial [Tepidisphaeraceae bacterium]